MRRLAFAGLVLAGLLATLPAQAQRSSLEAGKQAFREERFDEAAQAFRQASEQNPANAEAWYLLARVYFETPLKDLRTARRALDKALELEPDNLQFLVARLQLLREDSWNFLVDRIRESRRRSLAVQILKLDPQNAYAHEEMGMGYIRDFWRYRNAFMVPGLKLGEGPQPNDPLLRDPSQIDPEIPDQEGNIALRPGQGLLAQREIRFQGTQGNAVDDPTIVFRADRFDIDALRQQGVPIQDLSGRAQRAYERAIGHLYQALESDPRRRPVYDYLMQIYALKGEWQAAVDMLAQMYTFFPEDPGTWLYLGLAHYRNGNLDAASKSFETAFRYLDEATAQAIEDLTLLLPEDERQAYQADPVAFAARYWTSKDPRLLTVYNERKLEHFARVVYADLLYSARSINLRGWDTERGRILIRYGLPNVDVVFVPAPARQQLVDNPQVLVSATTGNDPGTETDPTIDDNQIAASAQRMGGALNDVAQANVFNVWDYGDFRFVFEDPFRSGRFVLYSPPANQIAAGLSPWLNDYVMRARQTFREVPDRYDYEAPGRQVEIPFLTSAFKGDNELTDLYVHFGIPITRFDPRQERLDVAANLGAFLISPSRDILVERRRTLYGLRTDQIRPYAETNLWVDTQEMKAPPGAHEVSVEFETASGGTVAVQRRAVDVPAFSAGRLAVSDMVLAYHVEETPTGKPLAFGDFVRHGFSIRPAPWSVFDHTKPIYLYFETYGLERGADGKTQYEVEIQLVPKDEARGLSKLFKGLTGRKKGVSIKAPGSGTLTDEGQYQILDAVDMEPGLYAVTLRVRDLIAKRTVTTEQDLFLE